VVTTFAMFERPESEARIASLVARLLREAEADGVLPTPIERLIDVARIENIDELPEQKFFESLPAKARAIFQQTVQKLRGVADLRERAIYVRRDKNPFRERFARGHELGHQVMPWHNVDPAYLDDAETLSANVKALFEREANFFSSQVIFQGDNFRSLARDHASSFEAIFQLADDHAASRQATAWRFVEEQDEAVALAQYYRSEAADQSGGRILRRWNVVASPNFRKRFIGLDLPAAISSDHEWARGLHSDVPPQGTIRLGVEGELVTFHWQAWWNNYAILVLLRRAPKLALVGKLLRPSTATGLSRAGGGSPAPAAPF
jgi:Zn-dependent peptidase ImmA (M78 family)